ncbi:MAG: LysE family translocator [Pseudomonadota bacterium]
MISPAFIAIWFGWVLAGGSPGPATLGIIGTSVERGRKAGLVFALGILAGSAAWGLAAALGLSAIMLANAWVFEIIRYLGAAYLGWLAIKALYAAWKGGSSDIRHPMRGSGWALFLKGAAIHITNPKAILSWGAIYAIVAPADASLWTLLAYFGMLYLGSILVFIGYAFLFSTGRAVRIYANSKRWFNLAFAAFFGFASFKILTAKLA